MLGDELLASPLLMLLQERTSCSLSGWSEKSWPLCSQLGLVVSGLGPDCSRIAELSPESSVAWLCSTLAAHSNHLVGALAMPVLGPTPDPPIQSL